MGMKDDSEIREIVEESGKRFFKLTRIYSTGGYSMSLTRAANQPANRLRVCLRIISPAGMMVTQAFTEVSAVYLLTDASITSPEQVEVIEE